ncbi:MAG: hypothetical protein J7J52_01905 [Deltaproteobacteria bacterium]|nr:hypothetical protein [Deltaproteobacteria bacterium]
MIKKGLVLIIALLFYVSGFYWLSLNQPMETFSTEHMNARLLPSVSFLKAVCGEFAPLVSDVFFAYGAVLASNFNHSTPKENWGYLFQVLKLSRDMDPYFKDPYRLVQGIYPWIAKMPDRAISFLKKGVDFRTWDAILSYYIGFDYYFFSERYRESARYLFMSARIDHNPFMGTLASKIAYRGGDVDTGITFLTGVLKNTLNEKTRNTIMMRINALRGVKLLKKAVTEYKKRYGRMPGSLEELVSKGIIHKLPENPYKTPYRLEAGRIRFD